MTLSELSVRRPVLVTMIFVLICAVACIYLPKLDIALYPSVAYPVLSVSVTCNDAGPEEIEMEVAKVLENRLGSVEGLENITTTSSAGRCYAMLEFSYKTDLDEAANTVNNLLSRVSRSLPDWAETPTMMRFDQSSGSTRILDFIITGPYSRDDLRTIAEDSAANLIMRVEGVAEVSVGGSDSTKYVVKADPVRLASVNLSLANLSSALKAYNTQGTGGTIKQNGMNYQITLDTRYTDLDQVRDTIVKSVNGINIRVGDVADVTTDVSESSSMSFINGEPVVMLSVSNTSDSNASNVAKEVIERLPEINAELPQGVKLILNRDRTEMISTTMNEVYKNAIEGVVLAAFIIFIFLRGLKTTFIIALSMPVSILITLMVMSIAGISVNSMSMSGLILGIGMIVDASICILENSYNYREKGFKPAVAAILGSKRMFNAILASTLTTICVFFPILIYRTDLGQIGIMFTDLIITICVSLCSSLFVAVILVPALFGSIFKVDSRVQKPLKYMWMRRVDEVLTRFDRRMSEGYGKCVGYVLRHKLMFFMFVVLLFVFSLTFFTKVGMSLTPQSSTDDSITLSLTMPSGTVRDAYLEEAFRLEREIESTLPEGSWKSVSLRTSSSSATLEVNLPEITDQKYSASQLKEMIRPLTAANARAVWNFSSGRGFGGTSGIRVEIHSPDSDSAKQASDEITAIIASYVPEATNISTDLTNGAPKYRMVIDYEKAADLGISSSSVLSAVQNAISGIKATTLNTFSSTTTYYLYVQFDEDLFTSPEDLGSLPVSTGKGNVRLDSFVTFERDVAARSIQRVNKLRVNRVTASVREGISASVVQNKVNEALDKHLILPEGVNIEQQGEMQQFAEYLPTLIAIILIALVLVYAVMAAQFESLIDPFIIFATIPMLLIGVSLIHVLANQDFSLFSIVGIVALIGVVVNNGIVLVDAINYEVSKKKPINQSCIEVATRRLRPILMTTLTTILGMFPMAFFPGEGADMMQPIALTFVGGMFTGAFMTLFLTPLLYSVFNKHKEAHFNDPMSLANQLAEYDGGLLNLDKI